MSAFTSNMDSCVTCTIAQGSEINSRSKSGRLVGRELSAFERLSWKATPYVAWIGIFWWDFWWEYLCLQTLTIIHIVLQGDGSIPTTSGTGGWTSYLPTICLLPRVPSPEATHPLRSPLPIGSRWPVRQHLKSLQKHCGRHIHILLRFRILGAIFI